MGCEQQPEDVQNIVVNRRTLDVATFALSACAITTQVRRAHTLRLPSDNAMYKRQDTQYDHDALNQMAIDFYRSLGLHHKMVFDQDVLRKLLQITDAAWLSMVRLPTTETQRPEECETTASNCART